MKVFVFLLYFVFMILSCSVKRPANSSTEDVDRFFVQLSQALSSDDENLVKEAIDSADKIIAASSNTIIKSIYLNKAQLLYKIKLYDDALNTLRERNDDIYAFDLAALLVKLGRINEAELTMNTAITANRKHLNDLKNDDTRKTLMIQGLLAMYTLLDYPIPPLLDDLENKKIINQQERTDLIANTELSKDSILDSIWTD
ncbi:MAG: hypothetical protein Ta2A_26340 [Treponemataceae bacterium]|nr:MAG: hypothetical protein Ta2A_26340 [Treponemataceae bacterium]